MAYQGVLDDIRTCIRGGIPQCLPVFACSEEMDVRLCGYTYEQFATDAKIMAKVMIESVKRLDYDWAWFQIDDCFIVENLGVGCKGEGNILRDTMRFLTDIEIEFSLAQLKAGADAIWLGDANASSHLMSVAKYREFAAEPCRKVIAAIQRAGGWTFLHASEESTAGLAAEAELKPSVLSGGAGADLVAARQAVGPKQCLLGNVDPILVLERGQPADVERQVKHLIDNLSVRGGHMLNSGDMIPRGTPEENVATMIRVAREHWAQKRHLPPPPQGRE